MGKRYIDAGARCPHYHSEDAQHIYCDGVENGTWVHLAFLDKGCKRDYKRRCCRGNYGSCHLAQMQEGIINGKVR